MTELPKVSLTNPGTREPHIGQGANQMLSMSIHP
jgi:hypothetical protein